MISKQQGFTLVELVVVIVLLGILGVTALGKYQDLSLQAQNAANNGIAAELSAASGINVASVALNAGGTPYNTNAETCPLAAADLLAAPLPTEYQITPTTAQDCSSGGSFTCNIDITANTSDTPGVATVLCTQ